MRIGRRRIDETDDVGLSLIELIVVVLIVGILTGVIVMILVNSWKTQEDVNSTTVATNEGQVYASSIERAVRNAEEIQIVGGNVLQVRTTLPGSRQCQSFQIVTSTGTGEAAYIASAAAAPSWSGPLISENVANIGSDPYFADDSGTVSYAFQIDTDAAPVLFRGTVAARNALGAGGAPCW